MPCPCPWLSGVGSCARVCVAVQIYMYEADATAYTVATLNELDCQDSQIPFGTSPHPVLASLQVE